MKRQQAKKLLPIIQAFAEGKTIQYCYIDAGWADIDPDGDADFSDNPSKYRIKSEPDKNQRWVKNKNVENEYYLTDGVFIQKILNVLLYLCQVRLSATKK